MAIIPRTLARYVRSTISSYSLIHARWASSLSPLYQGRNTRRPLKRAKIDAIASVDQATRVPCITEKKLHSLLQDAVRSYAESLQTKKRLSSFGIPIHAIQMAHEQIATIPLSSKTDIWACVLNLWAQEVQNDIWATFATRQELTSAYLQQGNDALHRACAQSFLAWLSTQFERCRMTTALTATEKSTLREACMQLDVLRSITDLRAPSLTYSSARSLTRQIHLHVGPTNSGKTHGALVTLSKARTGLYAGPLRLLAHEVWERMNQGTISPSIPPRACNLRTGEEVRVVDEYAGLVSCTVEMADVTRAYEVAVIDEIQMIADVQRGFAWTQAVLGLPAKELHLCGEASAVPLIQRLVEMCGDELHIHNYNRLSPLHVAPSSLRGDLTKVEPGDCVVAFSRSTIFWLKEQIEARTGLQCAVAYGALPPEIKSEQAKLFNSGKLDVMVASDAIGMGLNLRIRRVIFDTLSKWNGKEQVPLSLSQIKQIAGRAGRYGTSRDKNEQPSGLVLTRNENEMEYLRAALAAPVRPITHAQIQPSTRKLESLALLLPRARTRGPSSSRRRVSIHDNSVSTLLEEFHAFADLDAGVFSMADFVSQKAMSTIIEHRGRDRLTHAEKEKWSNTPVNMRDERAVAWVGNAIERYARGELVRFEACAKELGTMEAEEAIAQIMRDAQTRHKAAGSEQSVVMFAQQDETVLNIHTLMLLESLHRTLTLYLWLGFRFPLAFCFRHDVEARKQRTEASIEFCLEAIRVRRAQRLTRLGRKEEAHVLLKKHVHRKRR